MKFSHTFKISENTGLSIIEVSDNEILMANRLLEQQNVYEDKISDNILKLIIFFYLFTIGLTFLLIFYSSNFYRITPSAPSDPTISYSDSDYMTLHLSLLDFTVIKNNSAVTNSFSCFKNYTNCELETNNDCKSIDISIIKSTFQIECSDFNKFTIAGIIVNNY